MRRPLALFAALLFCLTVPAHAGADGMWTPIAGPFDPLPRADHAAFFDDALNRMVVVGPDRFEELWSLSFDAGTPRWTRAPVPPPYPPARQFPAYAFDAARRRVLLVAGEGVANASVWALELTPEPHWVQIPTRGGLPLERVAATAIFDPLRDRLVLYGGAQWSQYPYDEAWALSFADSSWSLLAIEGMRPLPRHSHAAAYDPLHDRMIVHGGFSTQFIVWHPRRDTTWALDFAGTPHWEMLDASIARPPVRSRHTLVVDEARHALVLHGGNPNGYGDTWASDTWSLGLDPGGTWTHLSDGGPPAARNSAAVIPARATIVYFGGFPNGLDAREFDPGSRQWTLIAPPEPALRPPRTANSWVMPDVARDRMVAWGSYLGWYSGTLWSYDLGGTSGWHAEPIAGVPAADPGTFLSSVLLDPVRDRLLVMGGGWVPWFDDRIDNLWEIPLGPSLAWNRLFPADTLPAGRADYSVVHDPAGDRVLVFGGAARRGPSDDIGLARDDLYALELSPTLRWRRLYPTNSPGARREHQAFLDGRGRMIVFGGWYTEGGHGVVRRLLDVWALDLTTLTWSKIGPDAPTSGRIAYDSSRDRIVLRLGGPGGIWALPLDGSGGWSRIETPWPWPTSRDQCALLYDVPRDRVMLFGGVVPGYGNYADPAADNAEVWALDFDAATSVLVSLVAARALADRVEIEWSTTLAGPLDVQRRAGENGWITRATVLPVGDGRVTFVDREAAPGARHGYRLRWSEGGAERVGGEVWVETAVLGFALYGPSPNPSPNGLTVRFALPDASRATIEVLDVAGRRVVSRTLAAAGMQVLRLDQDRALASGVYVVRLIQGARVAATRAVVLR